MLPLRRSENSQTQINDTRLNEPRFAQPLTTILQIALVELLRHLGIRPAIVVGHSSGEIAAAYAAGAISRHTAWKLSYYRGIVSSELADSSEGPRGAMMAVGLSEEAAQPYIEDILGDCPRRDATLVVACINSPRNITISGDEDLVHGLRVTLEQDAVFARVLKVPVAYHSQHMLCMAQSYQELIGEIEPGDKAISSGLCSMISSVTGKSITNKALQAATYWVQNMVSPVCFSKAMESICRNSIKKAPRKKIDLSHRRNMPLTDLLEIGPHSTLQGPIREIDEGVMSSVSSMSKKTPSYHSMLRRGHPSTNTVLEALGRLHCLGYNVDLSVLDDGLACRTGATSTPILHSLPEYPFDSSKTYWEEPRVSKNIRGPSQPHNELIGLPCADWNPLEPRWRNTLKLSHFSWLADHKVIFLHLLDLSPRIEVSCTNSAKIKGEVLFPAAGMLAMAIEAVTQISPSQSIAGYEFRNVAILFPLVIPTDDSGIEVQLRLQPTSDSPSKGSSWTAFSLFACRYDNFVEICRGEVKAVDNLRIDMETNTNRSARFDKLVTCSCTPDIVEVNGPDLYRRLEEGGYGYGPCFQGITTARRDGYNHAVGFVSMKRPLLPLACSLWQPAIVHPCLLDVMLQLSLPAVVSGSHASEEAWIPTYISKLSLSRHGLEPDGGECNVQVRASTSSRSIRSCEAAIQVCYTAGRSALLKAEGIELTTVADEEKAQHVKQQPVKRLCYDMVLKPDVSLIPMESLSRYIGNFDAKANDSTFFKPLQLYMDLKAHKNPGMRILELGVTAGTATRHILDTLAMQTPSGPFCRFARYDYTNPSQSVLETVSAEFSGLPKVDFRVFDPQNGHGQQAIKDQSYDLVIAEIVSGDEHPFNLVWDELRTDRNMLGSGRRSGVVDLPVKYPKIVA
jgi:acyl transferase domain-containing protein